MFAQKKKIGGGEGVIKQYRRSYYFDAIKFESTETSHIQEIIEFVGLPISVDYTGDGVKLRVIRGSLDVLVAAVGDYIVKDKDGKLAAVKAADFEGTYEEITA
ncbi:hypothetical protein [Cohnella thailandensis]|uniref:Uncharacterized protein n=1 Tax=Cohnella thailandensis TaxID=557557 RepID=A0A841SVN9_9BACL|nr:hypothetical protein [Cohnella thailandensis]MBB6632771.1 hypothetical protein [Cohnella thailandensis]MBP1975540.1 hypothetical protein [Cohnella thailandensis]